MQSVAQFGGHKGLRYRQAHAFSFRSKFFQRMTRRIVTVPARRCNNGAHFLSADFARSKPDAMPIIRGLQARN